MIKLTCNCNYNRLLFTVGFNQLWIAAEEQLIRKMYFIENLHTYLANMIYKKSWLLIILLVFLSSCKVNGTQIPGTATISPTLPAPEIITTSAPEPDQAAKIYLDSWKSKDYKGMYEILSISSKELITEQQYVELFRNIGSEIALDDLNYTITNSMLNPNDAQIEYNINLESAIIGDIIRDNAMDLIREGGQWRIIWDEKLILPELEQGDYLKMEYDIPTRANIYDLYGDPLALQTEATALGVYPDFINLDEDFGIVVLLARVTGIQASLIEGWIRDALPGSYLPIGEVASEEETQRLGILSSYGAVASSTYTTRLYPGNGTGPHIIGYVSPIQEEELDDYRSLGYQGGERVGREGLERWGESILSGKTGGALYIFNSEDTPIHEIGSAATQPGKHIYSTLDSNLQKGAQEALRSFEGAIVVIERDTGRLLAMASSPSFNPNAYEFENINWNSWISEITNDPNLPQFNRAARGQYPLGSVFKVITMAAALESGVYTPDTIYECGYVFEELFGFPRYDWTYERFQDDGVTRPSGTLNLVEGLIRSCNPYFWHIGLDLYNQGLTTAISDMARDFGLGSATGIEVIEEEPGTVPDPQSEVDAINLAIGQGDLLVTPLQVANFMAAIGNGGTLYRPQVVEKIVSEDGQEEIIFKPEVIGTLPLSPENLEAIQEGMKGVISSEIPAGTAYRQLADLDYPIAGKTGTATSGAGGEPHSWFAGYTFAENEERPDIAVAVIVENIGDGSEYAAPVFRRVIETLVYGEPQRLYKWESQLNITRSPTPIFTDTPTPEALIQR